MNKSFTKNFTVLGSAGGVAKAILSILNKSTQDKKDPIHSIVVNSRFYLVDYKQKNIAYYLISMKTEIPNWLFNLP